VKGGSEVTKYYDSSVIDYLKPLISTSKNSFHIKTNLKLYKIGGPYTLTITRVETKPDDYNGKVAWFYCEYVNKESKMGKVIIQLVYDRVMYGDQTQVDETLPSYYEVGDVIIDTQVFEGNKDMEVKKNKMFGFF